MPLACRSSVVLAVAVAALATILTVWMLATGYKLRS